MLIPTRAGSAGILPAFWVARASCPCAPPLCLSVSLSLCLLAAALSGCVAPPAVPKPATARVVAPAPGVLTPTPAEPAMFVLRRSTLASVVTRIVPGDCNCDGAVDFNDIDPFVTALVGQPGYAARYPGCPWLAADIDANGAVDFDDIDPFVARLAGAAGAPP